MICRVGVVGAGDIAQKTYLPLLADLKNCEIAAVYSRTQGAILEIAKKFSISKTYSDLDKFLQSDDFDTVFVCTPTSTHFQIAQAALENSKNVLVEKPLTTIFEDDIRLLNLAQLKSKNFCVAFNNYYREENEWLRNKIISGEVGEVQIINIEWYRKLPFPSEGSHQGIKPSGILMHLGAKLLTVALALLPDRSSFAVSCLNLKRTSGSFDDEDTSVSSILINDKVTLNMRLGWDIALPVGSQTTMEVFGKKGKLSNNDYSGLESDGHKNMINEFLEGCTTNEHMDLDIVRDTMTLLNALYQANQTKTVVSGKFSII